MKTNYVFKSFAALTGTLRRVAAPRPLTQRYKAKG